MAASPFAREGEGLFKELVRRVSNSSPQSPPLTRGEATIHITRGYWRATTRLAGGKRVTPAYGARNAFRRPLAASVCGRVAGGVPALRGRLLFSCGHENRADVCVFA
jgi:hypothetical protein